ncbi:MAG TPA: outer membrane protein [Pseudolabrys sp.]|nr:outer membrane protein [Pseudolabrys sp.]
MPTKAPMVMPPYNWTGFYVGLNAGGSWGHQDNTLVTITGVNLLSNSDRIDGFIGGGQIGYNWQSGQWVFGVEADIQGSAQKGDGTFTLPPIVGALVVPGLSATYSDKLEWFGTARARVGWAFDRWMPYVTGGWAFGHGKIEGTAISATTVAFNGGHDYSGWTVGGGVEWAFLNNWSAKVEYLYIDFGDGPTVAVSPALNIVSGRMTDNVVRAGLNYKFF